MNTLVYALVDKPSHVLCCINTKYEKIKEETTSTKQFKLNSNLQTFQRKENHFSREL